MVTVWVDNSIKKIKLQTDDSSVRYLLEGVWEDRRYNFFTKRVDDMKVTEKIYDDRRVVSKDGLYTFTLGIGWAAYIANVFKNFLSTADYNLLVSLVMADTYRTLPFPELRDYQNEDVLHLLKYKFGLFSCYTGYGGHKNTPHYVNYIVKNRIKTVKSEMIIPC